MRNLVSTYVEQFRQDRQKQIRLVAILAALAVVVAGIVFWQLHNTGVAMSNEVYCGQEEHIHDENCYETTLACGLEESEDHVHDDSCYETVLTCEIPEHTHTIECMTDESADVETADDWEATLPGELSGVWSEDVAAVAESQVGYTESTANFQLADDGESRQGYTRYGAWYGNEYGDWDAMFAAFCLNYAGISEEEMPYNSGAYAWTATLSDSDLYVESDAFTPRVGDLIFFDTDENGEADRVGIITAIEEDTETVEPVTLTVVEGNSNDAVAENEYEISDESIVGYGILPEQDETVEIVSLDEEDTNIANDDDVNDMAEEKTEEIPEDTADDNQNLFGIEDENDTFDVEENYGTSFLSLPSVDTGGHDSAGNYWTFLDSNVSPVSKAQKLNLSWNNVEYSSTNNLLSIVTDSVTGKKLLLLDLNSGWSNFESSVKTSTGYTVSDIGTLRFKGVGAVHNTSVDVIITFKSIKFYDSWIDGYKAEKGNVSTLDHKISILNDANTDTVWFGINYNDSVSDTIRYDGTYSYPCVLDYDVTISVVESNTGDVVNASFLQVASDIDQQRYDDYRGTWAEAFKTIDGFNGNFYVYSSDADSITIDGFGQVTVSAYGRGDGANDHENESYTLGGIYADTIGGSWTVGYTEGYCATELEIYNYNENDVTIIKEDTTTGETLEGAEFVLYRMSDGEKLYYNYVEATDEITWVDDIEDATRLITDENGEASAHDLSPDTFYLEEVRAPDGYILLEEPIEFTISTFGQITTSSPGATATTDTSGDQDILKLTIDNTPSTILPNTGGIGTTIFYITGAVLICGAAVTLVYRRRRRAVRS